MLKGDEPGHKYLKPGAICGCGGEGHMEAHFSGSGIERKFGERGENIPHDDPRWQIIKGDFHAGIAQTLERYKDDYDLALELLGFTGSVALRGPNMLIDLQADLRERLGSKAPVVDEAFYGEQSGLYGAYFAAYDRAQVA